MTRRSTPVLVAATGLLLAVVAGCSGAGPAPAHDLGAVPIPYPVPAAPQSAVPGHPVLVTMGDSVVVAPGVSLVARGPDLTLPAALPAPSAPGTVTLTAHGPGADAAVRPDTVALRDELDRPVPFTADPVTRAANGDPTLTLRATFADGHTVLTWTGATTVTWDFQVELD